MLDQVHLHTADAYEFLRNSPSGCWDFIFLDSSRSSYVSWWPELQRCFTPGVLVVDNAVFPRDRAPAAADADRSAVPP
ncbi:MAG UNVERIFIED_CONTAM: hypothetical protein LVR18_40455 [Planctomycetaceae bacterium]